uniref:Uncharacterized protein n=1 Tax=Arundo donax TaxID=35708 RepID=A0A0A8XV74_ARUDO
MVSFIFKTTTSLFKKRSIDSLSSITNDQ